MLGKEGTVISRQQQSENSFCHNTDVWSSRLFYLCLSLFFLVCAGYYAIPLWDSDFWWHIASGREIVQNGIPSVDPFGVFPATDAVRNDTVLKGQWLGQVVLYGLFDAGGINTVIAFRVLVLLSCLGLIVWRMRLLDVGAFVLWPVLVVVGLVGVEFSGERPQLLSFLFAGLFFVVLDWVEHKGSTLFQRRWLWVLPLITVFWANSHGGVLLGVALLILWCGLKLFDKECPRQEKIQWIAVTVVVVMASLLTPNGFQTYLYLLGLEGSVLQSRTSEYISAFQVYTLGRVWLQWWVVAYFILAILAMFKLFRRRRWLLLAVLIFLATISIASFRYFIFFVIISAPYVASGLQQFVSDQKSRYLLGVSVVHSVLLVSLLALFVVGIVQDKVFKGGLLAQSFPQALADFAEEQHLQGRSFNHMAWGGYLLWRLSPSVKMYIDGRMLDQTRSVPYTHILWATWQGIQFFEQENFQLVMMPYHGRFDPQRYKLIDYLYAQPEWRVVYRDASGLVFKRNERNQ